MGLMKNIAMSRDWKGFDFKLSQVDVANLQSKLDGMSKEFKDRALDKALRSGGKIFILEMKQRQNVSDRVDAGIQGGLRKSGGVRGYIAGASKGFPNPAWFEYGTLDKYTGYSNKHHANYRVKRTKQFTDTTGEWWRIKAGTVISGGIRPRPFVMPSFNAKYGAMINKMSESLGKDLKKYGR